MNITLSQLFALCHEKQASDLHLSPHSPPCLRVNGDLVFIDHYPCLDKENINALIYSVMDSAQQTTFEKDLELDFHVVVPGLADFRANVFHQAGGAAAVFRRIPERIPTLAELEAPSVIKSLLELRSGLILIAGLTGSGKSTTLAAMVDYINTYHALHILTIEDPIEFRHKNKKSLINQRQVFRDTPDFSTALRSALREDPNVIVLGEMRDLETIRFALTAAETGHLVLTTLHTSSAPRAISRMIDVFPADEKNIIRNQLADALQAVIFQVLVKKQEGGRVAAFEMMLGSAAIRNLIREDKLAQLYTAIQTHQQRGMCTLEQYLQGLVQRRVISDRVVSGLRSKEIFVEKG